MAIKIGDYNFDGPHMYASALRATSGVYVILGASGENNWIVIDVGESENVRERVEYHDRRPCWKRTGFFRLAMAAYYVPERERMAIERELRSRYNPPCGDR